MNYTVYYRTAGGPIAQAAPPPNFLLECCHGYISAGGIDKEAISKDVTDELRQLIDEVLWSPDRPIQITAMTCQQLLKASTDCLGKMNLEEYFERIGFHLATVQKLIHKQHVMSVPFENLSIHCGEKNVMDLDAAFNKIVRRGRGGWCLENNFLFGWVLREMRYDTTSLGSRVFDHSLNDFGPLDSHFINKVVIDGKAYITDVSFGTSFQLWEPLELVSGMDQPQAAGVFRLIDQGEMWVLEKTGRKPEVLNPEFAKSSLVKRNETDQIYCFTLVPREAEHFLEINHKLQNETSLFTNKSICSLQAPTGFRALIGWTYGEVTYKPDEGVDVLDIRNIMDDEIEQILLEKFNIKLQNKLQPVNNKSHYTF